MLGLIDQPTLDALCDAAVPGAIRQTDALGIEAAPSELAVIEELRALAAKNTVHTSMIGLGYYGTVTPSVIQRNVLENPAWYTAYTPYQPEISQGRLEALLNFQTMVADLTGLQTSGSSLLDEGTAAAEAMTVMRRSSKAAKDAVLLVDANTFPQTQAVISTRAVPLGIDVVVADLTGVDTVDALRAAAGDRDVFGVLVQYPGADGIIGDWRALTAAAHEVGALVTAAADLLALTLLTAPGSGARTSRSARPSASVCRWPSAVPTPATWPSGPASSGPCPVVSSGSPWTPSAVRHTASPSRRVSSTSVATRRRATSAPRRSCSR